MILRLLVVALAAVFVYGLAQTQPWAHSVWTWQSAGRFALAMAVTLALSRFAHRYWFYAAILVVACSVGIVPILGLAFVLLGALNLGALLFHREDDRLNLLAGFAIYVWLFSLTASFPIHTVWLWGLLLAAPILKARRFRLPLPRPSPPIAMPLVANFLLALKPEVSADGLSVHFAIVQWVKDHGRFHFDAANQIWAVNPMAGDWALAIANLFGGEYAARLLNYVWLLVIVSFVYGILRRRLGPVPAAWMTGIFAATPMLQLTGTSMFIENFWTAMILGALLAVERREFVLAATLAGASGASKLLGLLPSPILGVFALFRKPGWKAIAAGVVVFVGIAVVPYARAYVVTGNPVFHYANAVFQSPLARSDVNFEDARYPARLNWHTLYDVTFHTNWFVESEPGTAGYQWLWFLPLAMFRLLRSLVERNSVARPLPEGRGSFALELAALGTAVFMVVLVFSRQASLRYMEPAMPLITIAFAPVLADLLKDRWTHRATYGIGIALFALNLFQMPGSSGYHRDFALLPFSTAEREQYSTRYAPARKLVDEMNRIAPGAAVAFFDGDEVAGLQGPAWTSKWYTPRFADKLALVHSAAGYVALLREFKTEYIIAPREGHWHFICESAMNLLIESSTDRVATSGVLQLVKLRADARAPELPPAPPGTYDDANARIVYEGPWFLDQSFAQPAGKTITYASDRAALVRFTFQGDKLTYYFTKAFNRGKAAIEIDGAPRSIVDLHSETTEWQAHVTFDHLGPGPHTIVLRHAGPATSYIDVDQFVVE